jgi:hypothetical protein
LYPGGKVVVPFLTSTHRSGIDYSVFQVMTGNVS